MSKATNAVTTLDCYTHHQEEEGQTISSILNMNRDSSGLKRLEMHMNRTKTMIAAAGMGVLLVAVPLTAFGASQVLGRPAAHHAAAVRHIARIEGVTPTILRQDLKRGQTLVQIAGRKYSSAGALATALLVRFEARLDRAVQSGVITSARADSVYQRLHARVAIIVSEQHPAFKMLHKHGRHGRIRPLRRLILRSFAATCSTTPEAALTSIRAGGQTPLAICVSTNSAITQRTLVSGMVSAIKAKLDALAATHPILAQHEATILARVQARLNTWVVSTLPTRG